MKYTAAIKAQQKALHDLVNAYSNADRELKRLELQTGLYEHERQAAEKNIRDRMAAQVRQAHKDLEAGQAQARKAAQYVPDEPGANAQYYATQATRDLDGVDAVTANSMIRKVLDTGNVERAREYVATARKIFEQCPDMGTRAEYYGMRRETVPAGEREAKGWAKVCDRLEQRVALVRDMAEPSIAGKVGKIEAGQQPGDPVNTRTLFQLAQNLEKHAVDFVNDDSGEENDA